MEFVSHLLRLSIDQDDRQANRPSLTFQMLNQQMLKTTLIDHLFRDYRDLIRRQLLLNASTILITFDDDEGSSLSFPSTTNDPFLFFPFRRPFSDVDDRTSLSFNS